MFLVYVQEVHPAEAGRRIASGRSNAPDEILAHKNLEDRAFAASACVEGLKLSLPVLIDTMDGIAKRGYQVTLGATAVVDFDGKLSFYWEGTGVHTSGAEMVLKKLLADRPGMRE